MHGLVEGGVEAGDRFVGRFEHVHLSAVRPHELLAVRILRLIMQRRQVNAFAGAAAQTCIRTCEQHRTAGSITEARDRLFVVRVHTLRLERRRLRGR
jgi:hypothetical protein